jgi:hypothetical protein
MIAGVESGSTLRGSLVVVHAIATGIPLLENFFPFHWKFCVLIISALDECLIIIRYLVTSLVREPSACASSFMARATGILLRGLMTDKAIELDEHRGMAAQKATDLRRLLAEVEANEAALRLRQDELESQLIAAPAANWEEAAGKARYLLNVFAATLSAQDPRRQTLIAAVLADFQRLSAGP